MTAALPESPAQMDTCCEASWRSAMEREDPKPARARSEDVRATVGERQAQPFCCSGVRSSL